MQITFKPTRRDDMLTLSKSGDALTINDKTFDFSPLANGAELPREAILTDWIAGPVRREGDVLHLPLTLPHGPTAPDTTKFPSPITVQADGPIKLPAYTVITDFKVKVSADGNTWTDAFAVDTTTNEDGQAQEVHGEQPSVTSEGMIDWGQMTTPESRAEAALQEWRATAAIDRATFAILAATYGYITEDEAEKWASGTALPQFVADIIAASVPPEMRLARRIKALTQPTIGRDSEMIPAIAEAKGLTDEQVDAMFGWQGG